MVPDIYYKITMAQLAYARCLDNGELEKWPEFFVDNCNYKITSDRNFRQGMEVGVLWADSKGMLCDRISSLRVANIYEPHKYRHILSQPYILGEVNGEVQSETSFLVIRVMRDGPMDVFAAGRYIDRYKINGDDVKLQERIVVCDSSLFDTLLAIPL
jgi:anthranilate 1,2-dioxygenase small subunit